MYTITCPYCAHVASDNDFELSMADECFCPQCKERFELSYDDDDDEESEDDDE